MIDRILIPVKRDLGWADGALRRIAYDNADRSCCAVLKDQLSRIIARREGPQIGLVQPDAVFIAQQVVIRALLQRVTIYCDADQIVFVRIEGKLIGMGDRVLIACINRKDGRGDRNTGRGIDRFAGNDRGYAARQLNRAGLHDQLAAGYIELRGLHRAAAGDHSRPVRRQLADRGAAGGQDGALAPGGHIPQRRVQRQRNIVAGQREVGEAARRSCKVAFGQRGRGLHLGAADIGVARGGDLRGQPQRVGDHHVERRDAVQRDVAAADDDIALDRYVGQGDVPGQHALGDVQVALDGRIRQGAGRRDGDVLPVVAQVARRVGAARIIQRGAEEEIQDLGDLAALDRARRSEGAVGIAVDVALFHRFRDIGAAVFADRGLVRELVQLGQVGGGGVLVQAAQNGGSLLARQRALRVHFVVAHAVDVAVLDRDLHGLIVCVAAADVRKADRSLFGKAESAVDVAHELPALDRLLGRIVAGAGGGVDDTQVVHLEHILP